MNSTNEKDKNRRNKNPFDMFRNEDEIYRMLIAMERMMENVFRDMQLGNTKPGKSYVRGFNVNISQDGKPRIQEFGNYNKKDTNGDTMLSEERKPLVDIIESKDKVAITVELPGVEKEDINLDVKNQRLKINVDHPNRKYKKTIILPCDVKPKTTKASYKNGVLDIEIEKIEKGNDEDGFKAEIE
jgi:HSP20 family protein